MGHGGAGQPGLVVDQDLVGVDLVVIKVVYLGVEQIYSWGSDPDSPVLDGEPPVHLHPPGPPGDRPVPEHSVPDLHPAPALTSLRVSLQVDGGHMSRGSLLPRPAPH